jgi:hypothetical protein
MSLRRASHAIALALLLVPEILFAQAGTKLVFYPPEWDFGSIVQGAKVSFTVTVANPNAVPLTVSFIPTCGCLTVAPGSRIIAASGRATFLLSYDSVDDTGITKWIFIVRTNGPGMKDQSYLLHGIVRQERPAVAPLPAGSAAAGSSGGIDVTYYYTAGCRSCEEFLSVELPQLEKDLSVRIQLHKKDVLDPASYEELSGFADSLGATVSAIPALRVGNVLLQGEIGRAHV